MTDKPSDRTPVSNEEFERSLRNHADVRARGTLESLGGVLTQDSLPTFLQTCLRVPTEIRFDDTVLSEHQFAEPIFTEEGGSRVCVLHVRPIYENRPETLPAIAAYMAAAINYGTSASPELCESYGAVLMGLSTDEFYAEICRIADLEL